MRNVHSVQLGFQGGRLIPKLTVIIAVVSLSAIPVKGSAGVTTDFELTYKVEQTQPVLKPIGLVCIRKSGQRSEIEFRTSERIWFCVYTPTFTYVGGGRLPGDSGILFGPESTGQLPYVPMLTGGLIGWEPLVQSGTRGGYLLTDIDAIVQSGSHFSEPAFAEWDPGSSRLKSIHTLHEGKVAVTWNYDNYSKVGTLWIPSVVNRLRSKSSGLNIEQDDTLRWTMLASSPTCPQDLSDTSLILPGSVLEDRRVLPWSKFKYMAGKGSIEEQAVSGSSRQVRSAKPNNSSPALFTVLAALTGLAIGAKAAKNQKGAEDW